MPTCHMPEVIRQQAACMSRNHILITSARYTRFQVLRSAAFMPPWSPDSQLLEVDAWWIHATPRGRGSRWRLQKQVHTHVKSDGWLTKAIKFTDRIVHKLSILRNDCCSLSLE